MNLKKIIRRAYGSLAMQINQLTSKRTVMDLSAFYDTPVMTKCHHIVSALRYAAVEEHYGQNDFGKALYVKANHFDDSAALQADSDRFDTLINSIETKGYDMRSAIHVDLDGNCFNGTHRLALCVWFETEKVPVFVIKRHLKHPSVQDMRAYYRLSDQDYHRLEQTYQRMRERVQRN